MPGSETMSGSCGGVLPLPGDGLYGGCGLLGASLQGGRLAGRKSIAPDRFHPHAPHVGIARLGDRPSLLAGSERGLRASQLALPIRGFGTLKREDASLESNIRLE